MKLVLILVLLATLSSKAQDKQKNDSLRTICDFPIFTTCEQMPYLKNGAEAYSDTLKQYLANRNITIAPGKISFLLSILKTGEIKYVEVLSGDPGAYPELSNAIKIISDQWIPGKQNGRKVCCYRKMHIEIRDNNIKITVPERL